jgi:methylated-DNA-[protein]-cysteine S-methyltransferase
MSMSKTSVKPNRELIVSGRITPKMGFNERVWALTARVPKGRVTTYGHIARALGTRAFRAVGNALNRNPFAPDVPCHRVVGTTGDLTGFAGGLVAKKKILEREGVAVMDGRVDLERHLFELPQMKR